MKKCPYCAEEIQDEAIKCRFCGEYLNKKKKWLNCLLGCLVVFVASIILTILFVYLGFLLLRFIFLKIFFAWPELPHSYTPFTVPGIDDVLRSFGDALKAFWEKIKDFLHISPKVI